MSSDRKRRLYEQLFIRFSAKVEKALIRAMLVFFVLLVAVQLLLQIPYIRLHITRVEQLEGKPYRQINPDAP